MPRKLPEPFYLPRREYERLENRTTILPPDFSDGYYAVEMAASDAFLEEFGEHITDRQVRYFETSQFLFTGLARASSLLKRWPYGDAAPPPHDAGIEDRLYSSYLFPKQRRLEQLTMPGMVLSMNITAGRVVLNPLKRDEIKPVDPYWLGMDEHVAARLENRPVVTTKYLGTAHHLTNSLASVSVHEKVHGAQDLGLPEPIVEASAVYYQREVATANNWRYTKDSNMDLLADLFVDCADYFGNRLHRLVFGTATKHQRPKLLRELKSIFTNKEIDRRSKRGANKDRHIHWKYKVIPTGSGLGRRLH